MFTAFAQGRTLEQLGEEHALTCQRVRAVLIDEKIGATTVSSRSIVRCDP